MKRVNIYTYSTAKSPRISSIQYAAVGYVVEFVTAKGEATAGDFAVIQGMTMYQSELHVLKMALSRINTKCELHIYTECQYAATGFEKWLEGWKTDGWQTKRGQPVKNAAEWQALDALVQKYGHTLVFHVKEEHSFREWLKRNLEKEKEKCLKNLENSTLSKN